MNQFNLKIQKEKKSYILSVHLSVLEIGIWIHNHFSSKRKLCDRVIKMALFVMLSNCFNNILSALFWMSYVAHADHMLQVAPSLTVLQRIESFFFLWQESRICFTQLNAAHTVEQQIGKYALKLTYLSWVSWVCCACFCLNIHISHGYEIISHSLYVYTLSS